MNNLDKQYLKLLDDILVNGTSKEDRTGTGTYSVFGRQIRHNMKDGFPLLTTKKMAWKTMITELLWFLKGDTHIKFLLDNKCNIWNGDAYKAYRKAVQQHWQEGGDIADMETFLDTVKSYSEVDEWGELGPVYGKQWRNWSGIDQIAELVYNLKQHPDSRRHLVNAWNVEDLDHMVLPPCHYGFQCYVRNGKYLSLMWNQRSVDTFLGLPFNIASYGLLLMMIAKECDLIPDELIGNLGDVHLYKNHVEQAIEQTKRKPYTLPDVKIKTNINFKAAMDGHLDKIEWEDFVLLGYQSHDRISAPLSN
jgi:thymidylate synthase